jgi:hypothetical protein
MLSDQEWNVYKEIDIKDDINERMKEDFPMELINKKGERIN